MWNTQPLKGYHIVFIAAEVEYSSEISLAVIARQVRALGARTTFLTAYPSPANTTNIPGLEALEDADLAVFFIRYRALPEEQFRYIRSYIERGKPVVAFRTSTHGFLYPPGHPLAEWNSKFGIQVLGAPWIRHYAYSSGTNVFVAPGARPNPILSGIPDEFHVRSWLYVVKPYPPEGADILLLGQSVSPELQPEPGTEINPVAWTRRNYAGGRTFMTTLGHPEDFRVPAFNRLVLNGIFWALGLDPRLLDHTAITMPPAPNALAAPAVPSMPGALTVPAAPSMPGAPNALAAPVAPSMPSAPNALTVPAAPPMPGAPNALTAPAVPPMPSAPTASTAPNALAAPVASPMPSAPPALPGSASGCAKPLMQEQEPWIPLTSPEQMARTEYDVLIIGSGAGGGAVLWRLCEQAQSSGLRIGMIEAGGLVLPTHARNLPTFDQERYQRFYSTPPYTEPVGLMWPEYPGARRYRALGGRTLHWYLQCPRLQPNEFETWPITYQELIPYYLIAEKIMNVHQSYADGSALQEMLFDHLRFNGFPYAMDLPLAYDPRGTKYGQIHSNVFFSSILFMAYALNRRPFDLAVNTRAVRVNTEGGRAAGVRVVTAEHKFLDIRSKTVVLCASTFGTPRILLNSDIPGEAIGRYLVNHPSADTEAVVDRDRFPEVLGVASVLIPSRPDRKFSIAISGTDPFTYYWYHYKERKLLDELRLNFHSQAVSEPRRDNYVYLDPDRCDEYGVPELNVHFSYSERDLELITRMIDTTKEAVAAAGLRMVGEPVLVPPGMDNHESGTCRMGSDPATSVTNTHGQVHGVPGLYIADNSVLPLTGPSNPTLTTVALAIRTADYILAGRKDA